MAAFAFMTILLSFLVVFEMDFSTADTVANFPVGALMPGCITVFIDQDMFVEGDHTFSVSVDPLFIIPALTVGTPDTTEVTITDDTNDSKYRTPQLDS